MSDSLQKRVTDAIGHAYAIEGEIGRGGMSVVYRARDVRLDRLVAVKVLPPELAYDPAIRTRFTREAQTSAQLAHPHIVPIYDVGEREGIAYFVMALVTGGNLAALLAHEPRQPIVEARRLIGEIADALAYAHLRGVIHRDIKPDNILLDRETGRAMVTDFGIARAIESGTRLTVTGIAVGTPTYMSPEQAMGEREIDGRSDIYSLGVVAYQMLTGRVPFAAGNTMALLMKHVTEGLRPITELRPDAPPSMREAIERALMKSPEDRWPSAAALRDALTSDEIPGAGWRREPREPVRYSSPNPNAASRGRVSRDTGRAPVRAVSPRHGTPAARDRVSGATEVPRLQGHVVIEPEHLAQLTPSQRADLRLWHGRVELRDRITATRGYAVLTLGAIAGGVAALVAMPEFPPLLLAPIIPGYMSMKLWRRRRSLRDSGLRLRRVLLMPRAKWVLPSPPKRAKTPKPPRNRELEKLVPREILDGPYGPAIRRAVQERKAITDLVAGLPRGDRQLVRDLKPTVDALVERVARLAEAIHRLDDGIDERQVEQLDSRIAEAERGGDSPEGERRLALFRRQRAMIDELAKRRAVLANELESAGLALGNLRLDMIQLRASGVQAGLPEVTTATQQARALSREIDDLLDAVAELKNL